jgi:D-amino-acid dehydrogenase
MPQVLVLGAGAVGVSTALRLQQHGSSVVLLDRVGVGLETSYGNAGIIQREAAEPYAMPRDLRSLLAIGLGRSNDVDYSVAAVLGQAGPLARYWWSSAPSRYRAIGRAYATLIAHSTSAHAPLIDALGSQAEGLVRRDGYRVLFRSARKQDEMTAQAEQLAGDYGIAWRSLSASELQQAEPALLSGGLGGIHWLDPWTVSSPGGLIQAYGALFEQRGGTVLKAAVRGLSRSAGGAGWVVETDQGPQEAEQVVLALGPWSIGLLQMLGYAFPMVRKRGYHRHFSATPGLDLPLMDSGFGYVMAPMQQGLRLTSGAQLCAADAPARDVQLRRAEQAARGLLDLGAACEDQAWFGTRPCMSDMLPVIGEAPNHKGLWLHFGHGHQGFTLGPASADMLVDLMTGQTPAVDPLPFSPRRFQGAA